MFRWLAMIYVTVTLLVSNAGWLFAQTPSSSAPDEENGMSEKLDQVKAEADQLKNVWDKARLETTLYEQRSKRAYLHWAKATKSLKAKALAQRDKADLELQLSVEKRKLAFSQWQAAQLLETSEELQIKAFAQDRDTKAIQIKIHEIESRLNPSDALPITTRR